MLDTLLRRARAGVADTGLRFALLMILVAVSSVTMLQTVLAPSPNDTPGDALGCLLAAGIDPNRQNLDNLLLSARHAETLAECMSGVPKVENAKGLIATCVLLVAAAVVYAWLPRWRNRKNRTVPVEAVSGDTGLTDELHELRELSGTGPRVRFRVDPTRTTAGAVAYGRTGRYTVCLHAGLLARRGTDPDGFRAVVLHELAHIRNRDVDFAYGSTALWRVFVVLALLPYLVHEARLLAEGLLGTTTSPFWPGAASILTYSVLSGLLLVALVHLARADLLRRRELHADVQAVAWGAHPAGWDHPDPSGAVVTPLRRVTALLRTHPGWAERRRVLDDPARMSGAGALEMLLTGVGASLLVHRILVVPGLSGATAGALLTAMLVAPVLFLVLRRSVAAAEAVGAAGAAEATGAVGPAGAAEAGGAGAGGPATGPAGVAGPAGAGAPDGRGRVESGVRAGLWLGAGLVTGAVIGGGHSGNGWLVEQPAYFLTLVVVAVVPSVWSAQFSRLTLAVPGRAPRTLASLANFLVTLGLLWGGLRWWQGSGSQLAVGIAVHDGALTDLIKQEFPGPWEDFARELSVISAVSPALTLLGNEIRLGAAALLMTLVPLLLHICVRGTGLRLRKTLLAGLAGGLLCWAGFVVGAYAIRGRRPGTVGERAGAFQYVHLWWQAAAVIVACLVTAAVVAGVSRRHWMLRALLAALVVQFMAYMAFFLLAAGDGCVGPLNNLGDRCHWLPANGRLVTEMVAGQSLTATVLLSACAALAGAAVSRALRGHRPVRAEAAASPAPGIRPWRAVLKRSAALALAVPTCLLTAVTHADDIGTSPRSSEAGRRFTELFDTPPTARVAKVREWQALAWLSKGGLDRMAALSEAFSALGEGLTEAADQKPNANGKIELDDQKFTRLCATLGKRAAEARDYFPLPFRELDQPWSTALRQLQQHARGCQDALATGENAKYPTPAERSRRFQQSLDGMLTAMNTASTALEKLRATALPPKNNA
ncbi:M48 family metalloprotease [Streptomyces ficellus]|uniref:M48 family metalloprotease n=1 Tax=Streptomyces ficellus TaxID=1977088 RepID=A0ABT7ZDY3_9ACTN|nr:M48 family metalloprotease [Streptomyces ficellus]MDN3297462.1 M48 family metalloprotease [Streptomyces ficellus]